MSENKLEIELKKLATELPADQVEDLMMAIEELMNSQDEALQCKESEISKLSSIIDDLETENWQQSQKIAQLSTRIETLSDSDKELQKSQKIRNEASQLNDDNIRKERALERAKQELIRQQRDLNDKKKACKEQEKELEEKEKKTNLLIDKRSKKRAEEMHERFTARWGIYMYILVAYGILSSVLLLYYSSAFQKDFLNFCTGISDGLNHIYQGITASLGSIPAVILTLLIIVSIVAGIGLLTHFWIKKRQPDTLTLIIALLSFGTSVWAAVWLSPSGINSFILWILIQVGVAMIRWIIYYRSKS